MTVEILLFPGCDEMDVVAPFEIFRVAEATGACVSARLVTLDGAGELPMAHGLRVMTEGRFLDAGYPDVLVVPGGGWLARASRGTAYEIERGAIPAAIAAAHRHGTVVASICTGALLLAAAGILHDRPATTHHDAIEALGKMGAQIVLARVVDADDVVTAGGITAGIDLALWLVERFAGAEAAQRVESRIEYHRQAPVWQPGHERRTPAPAPT
jgi:transcriptional regulator GlxA family with amidase domain